MIANINQTASATFYRVRDQKVAKPSTYKERVLADRVVMAIMLLGTIIFSILSA